MTKPQVILIKSTPVTDSQSIWLDALKLYFEKNGKRVARRVYDGPNSMHFAQALVDEPDVLIVESGGGQVMLGSVEPDFVVTVERRDTSAQQRDPYEELIAPFLVGRIRVTPQEILRDFLMRPFSAWSMSEQRRIGKVMRALGWLRQTGKDDDGHRQYFYAAPGYGDPCEGERRFLQCGVCTGYYGRAPFGQFTPCPCGECERVGLYPPLEGTPPTVPAAPS